MPANNPLADDLCSILENTGDLWKDLAGERIFITGGTGFFGKWFLESFCWINRFLKLKAKAVVLTRNKALFEAAVPHLAFDSAVSFFEGDIRNFNFPRGTFSYIIHAATEASAKLARENPALMYEIIVSGTERTLEFAENCGARKLLFTSSGAVYGKQPPEISHIDEEFEGQYDENEEKAAYGIGKNIAERFLIDAAKAPSNKLEVKIARCFAFVGHYLPLDIHFAIGNFISACLKEEDINISGDGTPYRSYLYASDLMIWLWNILFKGTNCRPYNVGSEEAININDLAKKVVSCSSKHGTKINIFKKPDANKLPPIWKMQ
jgi:dTDP-glucose 4,6-dehydratase